MPESVQGSRLQSGTCRFESGWGLNEDEHHRTTRAIPLWSISLTVKDRTQAERWLLGRPSYRRTARIDTGACDIVSRKQPRGGAVSLCAASRLRQWRTRSRSRAC